MNADAFAESPLVVISYSWDSDDHISWVVDLAKRLRANGVDVQLDRWNVRLGSDLNAYMERLDDPSARVLVVVSDDYVRKASERAVTGTGAGVETQILAASVYRNLGERRVIPVIFNNEGRPTPNMPTYLKSKFFVDFRSEHEVAYEKLLRDLLDRPLEAAPPIGANPFTGKAEAAALIDIRTDPARWADSRLRGSAEINLSENSGSYIIGSAATEFKLMLDDLGYRQVRHYNDHVHKIGLVTEAAGRSEDFGDLAAVPMSNRHLITEPGDAVVILNKHGYWCLMFIDDVVCRQGFNGTDNILQMRYAIETNRVGRIELTDLPDRTSK